MATSERSVIVTALGLKTLRTTKLHASHSRLLWHVLATLPTTGGVVSHTELAPIFGTSPSNISIVLRDLCLAGFLQRGAKTGRSYSYKLNPALVRILT